MVSNLAKVYQIIDETASSNTLMQALSGALGFPWTSVADVGAIFTHYEPMLNKIRSVYGCDPLDKRVILPVIKGCSSDLTADLVIDKMMGQIPIVGVAANMICAKAMTWRIGLLFAMLSSRGDEISVENVKNCASLIRKAFPQESSLKFKKPTIIVVESLLTMADKYDDFLIKE